jgi:transposase
VTLEQVADPDRILCHEPEECSCCGASLARAARAGVERRQVFEVPEVRPVVTEHRIIARRCRCGLVTKALAPAHVSAPVVYGPRACALALGLWHGQFLARDRVAAVIGEVFGLPMAPGTVASLAKRAYTDLTEFEDRVRAKLGRVPVAGFDETGFRVDSRLWWVHVAQSPRLTLLTLDARRGREAMARAGVLPEFTRVAMHDAGRRTTPSRRPPTPCAQPTPAA